MLYVSSLARLAPVLKTVFHQCVISYTCSQSNSDGSVLKQSIDEKLFKGLEPESTVGMQSSVEPFCMVGVNNI